MHQPTSSARPSLRDTTQSLNISPPAPSKRGRESSKKLTLRDTTKAIHVAEKQAEVFLSPQRKRAARKSALKASLKTTSDFCANGILDSQIDSQQWYDLIQDGVSQAIPSNPAIEVEAEETIKADEINNMCANCAYLCAELERSHAAHQETCNDLRDELESSHAAHRAELERSHAAHREACNDAIKLARDYDSLVVEAKFLRESMIFAGAKMTEMAGGMSGTLSTLLQVNTDF